MMRLWSCVRLVCLLTPLAVESVAAESSLFEAVRRGDSGRLSRLLKSEAPVNVRDRYGATPLMYAAAYGTLADVQQLLAAGADVNLATHEGFTALMWSTGSTDKLNRLLKAGAPVNAVAKDGATAMLTAAIRGNLEAVRLLLSAGADPTVRMLLIPNTPIRVGLAQLAYATNDPGLRKLLVERAMTPELTALVNAPGSSPFSGLFIMTGFSMHPFSVSGVAEGVEATLVLGADPNAEVRQLARALPPLSLAAHFNDVRAIQSLLKAGADPNRTGTQGITPLMMAAAAEDANAETVRLLLDAGAKLDLRDTVGRTALDWALMQGDSGAVSTLKDRGGATGEWNRPVAMRVATPRPAREAVEIALKKLQTTAVEFNRQAKCVSCHHQSLTAVATSVAKKHGVTVDESLARHPTEASLKMWESSRENFFAGNCSVFGFLGNVSYGLFGMAEEQAPSNDLTDAASLCLSSLQLPDGRWEGGDMRPPLAGRTPLVYTALAIRALRAYMPPAARRQVETQIARARTFLKSAVATDTQGASFKLLGLVWSGAGQREIVDQVARLRSLQGSEGGWSQRGGMLPDAYATGQALYALHVGGVKVSDPAFRKGAAFLLRSQTEEGTWFVPSRTLGFQPYLDSGFPHGRDQFISAAATAWAAIALGLTL